MAKLLGIMGLCWLNSGINICSCGLWHWLYHAVLPQLLRFHIPELTKAAKIDGASFFRIFWSIFLPLNLPIIVVTVIWQFTQIWNDFLFGSHSRKLAHNLSLLRSITLSIQQQGSKPIMWIWPQLSLRRCQHCLSIFSREIFHPRLNGRFGKGLNYYENHSKYKQFIQKLWFFEYSE